MPGSTRLKAILCLAVLITIPATVSAQPADVPAERWVVHAARIDDLTLLLTLGRDSASLQQIGRQGTWTVLPDESSRDWREPVAIVSRPVELEGVGLELDGWRSRLIPQNGGMAVWLSPLQSEIGVARRLTPLPSELEGEWERAEPSPVGPRVRRLVVTRDEMHFYNGQGEPTAIAAAGVEIAAPERAVALMPEERSGAVIRLVPFDGGYLALEEGDEELAIVYRPDSPPAWLDLEAAGERPAVSSAGGLGLPRGRWLVGIGDRARQVALLEVSDEAVVYRLLGPNRTLPVVVTADSAPPYYRLELGVGDEARGSNLLVVDESRAVMWPDGEGRYASLRRVGPIPERLLGEWRLETATGWIAEPIIIEPETLRRPSWGVAIPAVGTMSPDSQPITLTLLEEDRAGRLIRLWPLGSSALITDEGDLWYRPGSRPALAPALEHITCPEEAPRVVEHLASCVRAECGSSQPQACELADAVAVPLRCTEDHCDEGRRRLGQSCQDLWPHALADW